MADAERDRLDLTTRIERLEMDKQELETENANKIEENRQLVDQLELLNTTVSESDTKIRSLEASLLSSQQAIRRLEAAAARAEDAERHLAQLEEEQMELYSELRITREDARTHAQRCKEAQRGILDMQDQLERMEKEAREERDRHAEVIERMERQREVEKQLDTAAGRLKGAAMTKSLETRKDKSSVVSHFVRDLLQDNANLQLGMAELREMLLNSNDEIQSLREQLMHHQPVGQEDGGAARLTLQSELGLQQERGSKLSQELHIHHHYHVARQEARKPKKKRQGITAGVFSPPRMASPTPGSGYRIASSPLVPQRSHTPASSQSWTPFSNPPSEFASSVPNSPPSNRVSSVFDSSAFDNGPPTSPTTSFDPTSPTWRAHHKRPSAASFQSFQAIPHLEITPENSQATQHPQWNHFGSTIQEEDEESRQGDDEAPGLVTQEVSTEDSTTEDSEFTRDERIPHPRLHRSFSHESIMSLAGGLDIHTLKSRPSQMTLRPIGGLEAVVTGVNAQPTLSISSSKRSDVALRDHFAGYHTVRSVSGTTGSDTSRGSSPAPKNTRAGALGKLVGWRPWGGSNGSVSGDTDDTATQTSSSSSKGKKEAANRTPGINQPGAIPGFQEYWASQKRKGAPAKVHADMINREALSEGLQE